MQRSKIVRDLAKNDTFNTCQFRINQNLLTKRKISSVTNETFEKMSKYKFPSQKLAQQCLLLDEFEEVIIAN